MTFAPFLRVASIAANAGSIEVIYDGIKEALVRKQTALMKSFERNWMAFRDRRRPVTWYCEALHRIVQCGMEAYNIVKT